MIRDVDLTAYLPPFMQEYREPMEALNAENPEFTIVWEAADRVLHNRFIGTADEYGISRFEKLLGIYPSPEDTLESRRSRVRSQWFNKLPYTIRVLLERLKSLCGDTGFTLDHNFDTGYTLTLTTALEMYGEVEELERIIEMMIPVNIVFHSSNVMQCMVKGVSIVGGGVCHVDQFTITNDFREKMYTAGTSVIGGAVMATETLNVVNDGRSAITIEGEAYLGSSVAYASYFEMKKE